MKWLKANKFVKNRVTVVTICWLFEYFFVTLQSNVKIVSDFRDDFYFGT